MKTRKIVRLIWLTILLTSVDLKAAQGSLLESLPVFWGRLIKFSELKLVSSPIKGTFVHTAGDAKGICVAQTVRSLSDLPERLKEVRNEMRSLSFQDDLFNEAACFVFVDKQGNQDKECIRGDGPISISAEKMTEALQRLGERIPAFSTQLESIVFLHSHPDAKLHLERTGNSIDYLGLSNPDLSLHIGMELKFALAYALPFGAYVSIVFPMDRENEIDFFYSARTLLLKGQCPTLETTALSQ